MLRLKGTGEHSLLKAQWLVQCGIESSVGEEGVGGRAVRAQMVKGLDT